MDRFRTFIFAVPALALFGAVTAFGQTAASITAVSGNGQLTCQGCFSTGQIPFQFFFPIVVRVLDANGNGIGNKEVDWALVSSGGGAVPFFFTQTFTDGNGYAVNSLQQQSQPGNAGFPFLQMILTASADGVSTTITETQGLATPSGITQSQLVFAAITSPGIGTTFSGTTGAPATDKVIVHVDGRGLPVPGVSVRLINANDPAQGASASCATGVGADPGSVLTDSSGNAACTVVFGSRSGTGSFGVIVGGIDPAGDPTGHTFVSPGQAFAYFSTQTNTFTINVTPGVPGQIQISSGNNQTVNRGQSTQPLVVKVTDAAGTNPISGQAVTFTVTPAGAATVSPTSTSTDSSGLASTVAILSANATGVITVRAALTGALSNIASTFTITTNVQITGLQKVSGDAQSGPAGQAFPSPIVVQVNNSTGQPAAGQLVSFSISGSGTLNTQSASTDSNGRAQVNVTAGSSPGPLTITASVGAFTQTFTLTVIPPGPNLSNGPLLNGADFQRNSISPCSIATLQATGLAPNIQGIVIPSTLVVGPLPYTLASDKVTVGSSQAPIFSVSNINGQEQLTFQVPCDVVPGSGIPLIVNVGLGSAQVNITVLPASPGIFGTVMSDGVTRAIMVRPDGSFVSLQNPARRGEIVRMYATGLGPVSPPVATNAIAVPGTDSLVTGQLIVGVNNAGARVISARQAPTLIGVYEVTFQIPSDAPSGNDVVLSLAENAPGDSATRFSGGSKVPIQ